MRWSYLMAEYEVGEATQRAFCTARNLCYRSFCRWRKPLQYELPEATAVDPLIDISGLPDGYGAYERYAQQCGKVVHAGYISHCRRYFERAVKSEPNAEQALDLIGELYRNEKHIGKQGLSGAEKLKYRTDHSLSVVELFWQWCREQCHRGDLLPRNPLSKALKHALSRVEPLKVFLSDPDVAPDPDRA